jgi:hypothetical protein
MTEATNLETRRAEITTKLESLRVSPQVAELVTRADQAVRSFKAEAAALEYQIADLDREVGAKARHQRTEAQRNRQDEWLQRRKALLEESEVRLTAIADAQAATRALVDAINRTLASNARMAKLAQQLSVNGKLPMALSATELVSRISGRIGSVLGTIKDHRHRFGSLQWPGGSSGLYPANGPEWREAEESLVARQLLQPLLEHGKA